MATLYKPCECVEVREISDGIHDLAVFVHGELWRAYSSKKDGYAYMIAREAAAEQSLLIRVNKARQERIDNNYDGEERRKT